MSADGSGSIRRLPLVSGGTAPDMALAQLIRRLAVARTLGEIVETVAAPARTLMRAGGVTVVLREDDGTCFYAEEDALSPLWKGKRFPMEACISGWCMLNAKAVAIPDIYQDSRIPHDAYRPTFVRSLAMVPVPQDRPIAAMGAYWPHTGEPSGELVELLQAIGNVAALAIQKVRAQEDVAVQSTLRSEVSHRVKNVFAMVQALINQTRGDTIEGYRDALSQRLQALAPVYAAIHASQTGDVELGGIFRSILCPLGSRGADALDLDGPPVLLPDALATQLALVVSELGTNAVKHGALGAETGKVLIRWRRDGNYLRLSWTERHGPTVRPPAKDGFGTKLIKRIACYSLNGEIELRYEPDGLRCDLRMPHP